MAVDFNVAAGAHAFGYLAAATLVAAAAPVPAGAVGLGSSWSGRVGLVSWLALAAAASKLTMAPLAVVALLASIAYAWRTNPRPGQAAIVRAVVLAAFPWLAVYAPLAVFTSAHSGSPFGPMAWGALGFSAYTGEEVRAIFETTRRLNTVDPRAFLLITLASHSVLTWTGVIVCVATSLVPRAVRVYAAFLTVMQFGLILFAVQNDVRFLGGYQYGLTALAGALATDTARRWARAPWVAPVLAVLGLGPWLAGMVYYATATPFAQSALGLYPREAFVARFTALRQDFLELDRKLPPDAVLWVSGLRVNAANACRPVVLDPRDLSATRRPFLMVVGDVLPPLGALQRGDLVYENPEAIITVFRRPGTPPVRGWVRVFELVPSEPSSRLSPALAPGSGRANKGTSFPAAWTGAPDSLALCQDAAR